LAKYARNDEDVRKLGNVARRVGVTFNRGAADPRLPTGRATDGDLSKRRVVAIALEDLAELMIVALAREGRAASDNVPILQQELAKRPGVVSMRLKSFDVRRARRR
jgi:hypothetical protein